MSVNPSKQQYLSQWFRMVFFFYLLRLFRFYFDTFWWVHSPWGWNCHCLNCLNHAQFFFTRKLPVVKFWRVITTTAMTTAMTTLPLISIWDGVRLGHGWRCQPVGAGTLILVSQVLLVKLRQGCPSWQIRVGSDITVGSEATRSCDVTSEWRHAMVQFVKVEGGDGHVGGGVLQAQLTEIL